MQISRHWRLNNQRYRLEGVRYADGRVSLQPRPVVVEDEHTQERNTQPTPIEVKVRVPVTVGR